MARIKLKQKRLIGGAIFGLFFIMAGLWVVLQFNLNTNTTDPNDRTKVMPIKEVRSTALQYTYDGDTDKGLEVYDKQIAAQKNENDKYDLLLSKSRLATFRGRYDEAIEAANQANSIKGDKDGISFQMIAEAYEASGDKEQAITYYKKAIEVTPKQDTNNSLQRGPTLEEIVEELER